MTCIGISRSLMSRRLLQRSQQAVTPAIISAPPPRDRKKPMMIQYAFFRSGSADGGQMVWGREQGGSGGGVPSVPGGAVVLSPSPPSFMLVLLPSSSFTLVLLMCITELVVDMPSIELVALGGSHTHSLTNPSSGRTAFQLVRQLQFMSWLFFSPNAVKLGYSPGTMSGVQVMSVSVRKISFKNSFS